MKKTSPFFYLLSIICFLAISGCAKREITNIGSIGKNIICFGDSITFGYGANSGDDFPTAMEKLLGQAVINAGIDGDTTSEALQRFHSDVLERDPLLVIIEFGGNDFLRKYPKETTVANIREMVEKAQAKGAMVAIADISAGMFLSDYRKAFKKLADEKGCIFIPSILSRIITNPNMKSDFMHPNAEGYKLIAERIVKQISPYLKQNSLLNAKKASSG